MDKWLSRSSPSASKIPRTLSPGNGNRPTESDKCKSTTSVSITSTTFNKNKKTTKRKYDSSYLSFGFSFTGDENKPIPQCVICFETLSNHSMKPSLLMRHFNTKHENLENKPLEFFKRKESELKANKGAITSFSGLNARAVEASYKVSLRIAREGKPHTIGETLLLPAAKDIVSSVLGDKEAKQLDVVSLSNSTVSRRISDMASNVKDNLLDKLKSSIYFSIQFDESTDITNMAQLLCFVRYEDGSTVGEDMLFCESLPARTTGEEIFFKLNEFMNNNGLDWNKCVGVCTDGARAMTGNNSGVVAKIKAVAPHAKYVHCSLHREALVAKRCPAALQTVLREAVKTVNFIKARALNSRLFYIICDEMGSDHKQLLLHTEVRWLSRGRVLSRIFELRHEVHISLSDSDFEFRDRFTDELWLCRLAYLADVFSRLNDVNQSLQGSYTTPFRVCDKINALKKILSFAQEEANNGKVSLFPCLQSFVEENEVQLSPTLFNDIKEHCKSLISNFTRYFPEDLSPEYWVQNPFSEIKDLLLPQTFTMKEKEELFELNCDSELKRDFSKMSLIDFWIHRRVDYSGIADKAIQFLLPFSTSYLCEAGFSSLVYLKNKYRNRVTVEPDLRIRLSYITPDIKGLSQSLQAQPSH